MSPPRTLAVIPARLASSRLPRKVLRQIAGRPMLAWVVQAALACPQLDEVVVATDSDEVLDLCQRNGWAAVMSSPDLPSGSDRVHAVAQMDTYRGRAIYINIQADEPLLTSAHIAALLAPFHQSSAEPASVESANVEVTTLRIACPHEELANPNVVKVVSARDGRALYFSRAPIPFARDGGSAPAFKHLGLYAFRGPALQRFHALEPSPLEQIEKLEQLRLLENNIALYVADSPADTIGVDTEADLIRVEQLLLTRRAG